MSNYPLPADARLQQMIRESFDAMPRPDSLRINRLEARLERIAARKPAKRPNTLPWWIVLLLTGGFVAAAWWAGVSIQRDDTSDTDSVVITDNKTIENEIPINNSERPDLEFPDPPSSVDRESPVIYQRENF